MLAAVARSSLSSISLAFSGALNADMATDASCYSVEVNDVPVEIESVAYNTGTAMVTLGLIEGALHVGDRIEVKGNAVQDINGRDVSRQTPALTAR